MRRPPFRKLARALAWIAGGTLLASSVTFAVGVSTEQLRATTMLTGSMAPELPTGSVIILAPRETSTLQPGDVIAFNPPDSPDTVIHRIIDIESKNGEIVVTTKGDVNEDVDAYSPFVLKSDTVWQPKIVVPGVGRALWWIQGLRLPALILPAVAGMWLWIVWRIWKPRHQTKNNFRDPNHKNHA